MREILFRGQAFGSREWVYGHYRNGRKIHIIYHDENSDNCYAVRPESVSQFTGLVDKNGTKIFEWDILKIAKVSDGTGHYYFPPLEYPLNAVVKWDLCAWMWETLCDAKRYIGFPEAWCHYECEIIGNIHDNPELLEG